MPPVGSSLDSPMLRFALGLAAFAAAIATSPAASAPSVAPAPPPASQPPAAQPPAAPPITPLPEVAPEDPDFTIAERPIRPMRFNEVDLHDPFWVEAQRVNRRRTLLHLWNQMEKSGRLANFATAAKRQTGQHQGPPTADADVYRLVEGAAYALADGGDEFSSMRLDDLIKLVVAAQLQDGYLGTAAQLRDVGASTRWSDMQESAELVNLGALLEAGVAMWEAQGRREPLDTGIRAARLMALSFGPNGRRDIGTRPGLELGLQRLHDVTGTALHDDLARWLLERRRLDALRDALAGDRIASDPTLAALDDEALLALCVAGARYAREHQSEPMKEVMRSIWNSIVDSRASIIGSMTPAAVGAGSRPDAATTVDGAAEAETSTPEPGLAAAINLLLFAHEMAMLDGDARPFDVAETALYNAVRGGVSLSGDRFFASPPAVSDGTIEREAWFEDASGPTNLLRLFGRTDDLIAARDRDVVYINLYAPCEFSTTFGRPIVRIAIRGEYPWTEKTQVWVQSSRPNRFTVALRVPSWCDAPELRVNHELVKPTIERGYIMLDREWSNDILDLTFPMSVRVVPGDPDAPVERGRFALMRGPIVYCVEGIDVATGASGDTSADGGTVALSTLRFDPAGPFEIERVDDLLGGVVVIKGSARRTRSDGSVDDSRAGAVSFTAIPSFASGNRGATPMLIWLPAQTPGP